jgi:hypothetical protein
MFIYPVDNPYAVDQTLLEESDRNIALIWYIVESLQRLVNLAGLDASR